MNPAAPSLLVDSFTALAASSGRAAAMIVVVLALRAVLRGRLPAQIWVLAWLGVGLRLLLPINIPVSWWPFSNPDLLPLDFPRTVVTAPMAPPATEIAPEVEAGQRDDASGAKATSWREWLAISWLVGATALGLARIWSAVRFRRLLQGASRAPERVQEFLRDEARRWRAPASVACLETDAVATPALFGLVRPRILLPPGFADRLDDDALRWVLRHELAHCQRWDLLGQAVLQAAAVLHWCNPLVWLAVRRRGTMWSWRATKRSSRETRRRERWPTETRSSAWRDL